MDFDELNKATYEGRDLVDRYVHATLLVPEVLIFFKYKDEIAGRRVLDMGCGAGRTAKFLSQWTDAYTASDYSSQMLERAKEHVPGARFLLCDVRDMGIFADREFDTVFFLNNGLDSLGHEDRLRALAELRRVLKPGGLFAFSSHNRNHRNARLQPQLEFTPDPVGLARSLVRYRRRARNRARNRPYEREEAEYAIINDRSHNYALITYYMTLRDQVAQIRAAGFEPLEVYDLCGNRLPLDGEDTESGWLHYVARRS